MKQHVIFLRNVLIYFDEELQAEILKTIAENCLADGGYLFLSQKEAALINKEIIPSCLKRIVFDDISYFHKKFLKVFLIYISFFFNLMYSFAQKIFTKIKGNKYESYI